METVMKTGIKTSEFQMTMLVHVAVIIMTALDGIDAQWAIVAMAVVQAAYTYGRSQLKIRELDSESTKGYHKNELKRIIMEDERLRMELPQQFDRPKASDFPMPSKDSGIVEMHPDHGEEADDLIAQIKQGD